MAVPGPNAFPPTRAAGTAAPTTRCWQPGACSPPRLCSVPVSVPVPAPVPVAVSVPVSVPVAVSVSVPVFRARAGLGVCPQRG